MYSERVEENTKEQLDILFGEAVKGKHNTIFENIIQTLSEKECIQLEEAMDIIEKILKGRG